MVNTRLAECDEDIRGHWKVNKELLHVDECPACGDPTENQRVCTMDSVILPRQDRQNCDQDQGRHYIWNPSSTCLLVHPQSTNLPHFAYITDDDVIQMI